MARDDDRWNALDSRQERLALFAARVTPLKEAHEKAKEKAAEAFKEMLKETESITPDSRWSRVSETLRGDPRYGRDILSSEERERLFRGYTKELKKIQDAAEIRRKREEISKQERERAVRAERESQDQLLKAERTRLLREKETSDFIALLAETVHNSRVTWSETRHRISKDPRDRTQVLTREEKEQLFRERIASLQDNRVTEFRMMLKQLTDLELNAQYRDIRPRIRDDPRFAAITSERQREELFVQYLDEVRGAAEEDLRVLFLSCPKITKDTPLQGPEFDVLQDMLRGDLRWQRFDCVPRKRVELLDQYIRDLRSGRVALTGEVRRI